MPALYAVVITLAVLVGALLVGGVFYAVHRRPALNGPVTAAIATISALTALLALAFTTAR
ncbi:MULTISPECIES: hypothetical protein [Streptomyces]|uniref:Uncharacterized protein n=1 Tax=Streptomyces triticiradicis TaxID=2651189 RepID=A0A7J5D8G8_9ACTN|nr:hypothetical protein [Streptomyces triticiradicis]KAB1982834.1 hypothetical protein F8144_29940 [Streptomyces triticiradicis]